MSKNNHETTRPEQEKLDGQRVTQELGAFAYAAHPTTMDVDAYLNGEVPFVGDNVVTPSKELSETGNPYRRDNDDGTYF